MKFTYPGNIALAWLGRNNIPADDLFTEQWLLPDNINECLHQLKQIVAATNAEWLLIWEDINDLPSPKLLSELTDSNVDIWHAGMRMGLSGMPQVMNYVAPTWMYNKDADENTEHSSFRLSIRVCLLRISVLKQFVNNITAYTTLDATGLALGYKMFKSGCIMRYQPQLIKASRIAVRLSLIEEWSFAKEFYTKKWHAWILLSKSGFFKNIAAYLNTKTNYNAIRPCVHTSEQQQVAEYRTVSVLSPTLKRYSYLRNELKQLSVQSVLPHEVLITDQTDAAEREVLNFEEYDLSSVKYFPQQDKGQCLAWNKLLSEATSEYVLFLGDDADHITPDFIEKLLATAQHFNADMVASNVIEIGMPEQPIIPFYYVSDTFPITLIRKRLVDEAGRMDMFFNRNIRADQDLAMRCHLLGSLMIFNPSATIHHHRAAVGGLRTHKARVVTNFMAKNSITQFLVPTSSEIYLVKKYFNDQQFKSFVRIKYFNQLMVNGNLFKKFAKLIVFAFKYPSIRRKYRQNLLAAEAELLKHKGKATASAYESVAGN